MSRRLFKGGEFLVAETKCEDVFVTEDFDDEQRQMAETAEQFILNEVNPKLEQIEDKDYQVTLDLLKQAGELGLMMMDVPEEYGGLELDKSTCLRVAEATNFRSGSFGLSLNCHTGIGSLPLIYYGTPEQKERYLEKLAFGEMIGAYCLTEPGSGSDALAAKTTAVLSEDGKHYILNGTKQFITNGGFADLYTVFAKVDKEHFTGFLVERNYEGCEPGPEEKKMGLNGSSTTPVILTNCKVPVENVLGEIGKGHKIAFNILNIGRLKLAGTTSGQAKEALEESLQYTNERKQFGQKISNFGAIKEKLADMTAAIYVSESVGYRIAGMIDDRLEGIDKGGDDYYSDYLQGIEEYAGECAMAKVFCTEVFRDVADAAVQCFGGYGYIREYPVEGLYRTERIQRLYEGTNEINRMIIPGTFVRKAGGSELALFETAKQAVADIASNKTIKPAGDGLFAAEYALIRNLRTVATAIYGQAAQTYQKKLGNEQEILLALADISMQLFALESAVLRAEKVHAGASETKRANLEAVVKTCAFDASEKFASAARRALSFIESDNSAALRMEILPFCIYNSDGLLQAKRTLANAASESEKYLF